MKHLADAKLDGLKAINPLNTREHHFARARRAKQQRQAAYWCTVDAMRQLPAPGHLPGRFVVILTRVHPQRAKPLDEHDALPASLKHVVDGICDRLGVDDGDKARVRFVYRQEVGPWAVLFTVALEQLRVAAGNGPPCSDRPPGGGGVAPAEKSAATAREQP